VDSGDTFRAIKSIRLVPEAPTPFYTPGEIISILRAAFSLNITEVARVLQVKRPTIYAWINDAAEPHAHNLTRLNELLRIARHWMRLSNKPLGAFVRQADRLGQSLVDFLSSEVVDEPEAFRRLGALHKKLSALKPRKSIREAALQRGMDLSDFKDQQDVIDWITGKRPESE
jgi:predicted DNA-binding transcriptional regulator AlpA